MKNIQAIRTRLRDGEATEDDMTWAQSRRRVLAEWPEELSPDQSREAEWLDSVLGVEA